MQICFRCDETTNTLLDKISHANGISKNRLINNIIQDYLERNPKPQKAPQSDTLEKGILTELRLANETLALILAQTNECYFRFYNRHTPPKAGEPFQDFRRELIKRLDDISKKLDGIRKEKTT